MKRGIMEKTVVEGNSMGASYHRHDVTDEAWALIEPHPIKNKGTWGVNARDTRLFINVVSLLTIVDSA